MAFQTIIYTKKNHVSCITLNRPDAGNRINRQMAQELEDVCSLVNQDMDVYVVVLTGTGGVFCAGAESEETASVSGLIASVDRPVIAAINGDALGQGLEIALACDIRLASDTAMLGMPQIAAGAMPSDGGTQRLPRIVGKGKALELILTGEKVSAGTALEIGLVNKVVTPDKLESQAVALAESIAGKAPVALRYIKEAVNAGLDLTMEQGLRLEADLYFLLHTTADRTEGIKAFLAKKKPQFRSQ
ncbi:MAG: enoyl-CoA hydratase-related protein [Dehalococcoidia bacterium]|nr:enoyl-CoA hydratase-related protein [Dehalococcoidia bacterium]